MQTKQTVNEGLKRAYLITIPAADLTAKIDAEIKKVAPQVRMPGFRPGKVPANLVKKMHGEALHGQVVNDTIRESVDKLLRDEALRPAMQPEIGLNDDYEQGKDAAITVSLEVLPTIEAPSIDGLKLEKLVVPVTDAQIDEALGNIASQNKSYKDAAKTKKAADGDQLIIDFVGKLDGVEFDGGKAEDAALVLGSGTFIPGFEDQLVGVKTGQEKTITVTFPADYQAAHLAGKDATFDITVKAVKVETETTLDEEFAKSLGLDSLDKLKEIMKAQLEQQTAGLTRTQMKRALLDQLAAGHSFEVPGTMVEAEFAQIWAQLQQEAAREEDPAAALKQIEDEKDEYKSIAERRVRLGLLLSEIGQANGVEVTGQEMGMLIQQAAQQYRPEDRQRFVEYVQSDPMAAAQLRAPLYEDKVVDFLFDKADVTEREVTIEELQAAIEAEDGAEAAPAPKKAAAKKKAPAKKAEAAEEAPAAEEKPAKKAPAKKAAPKKEAAAAEEAEAKPAKKAPAKKAAAKK
ncbi:trigger factor [Porphyrobacter sp. TH134]|uniref:trigger factor n=1 Tax=Porphyrobacter sp. TH134 TaxID=2067450 RepID=UPI000C7A3148|nr:trigger factor [Porphyrobacter sp. TH134]PLK23628.1 trigger factor [Porphyrobacter sp. TH134]